MNVDTTTPWNVAYDAMNWRQGEHVTLIGPTGRGKTELTMKILENRKWVLFVATKKRDDTLKPLRSMGYRTIKTAAELNPSVGNRFVLQLDFPPRLDASELKLRHMLVLREILMRAYRQTGWTVVLDEARYICDYLGLKAEVMLLWLQGRSQGNSVVCSTQRARFIPLEAYDQATHLFLWTDPDSGNLGRNSEIIGTDVGELSLAMESMSRHDVIHINHREDTLTVTNTRE